MAFESLTAVSATSLIMGQVYRWAKAHGWRCRSEQTVWFRNDTYAQMPSGGCVRLAQWGRLDLYIVRPQLPSIAVEIDRTAAGCGLSREKLSDAVTRGHLAVWINWYEQPEQPLPPGVARLSFSAVTTKRPLRYHLPTGRAADTMAIEPGRPGRVIPEGRDAPKPPRPRPRVVCR